MEDAEIELKGLKQTSGRPFRFDKIGIEQLHFLNTRTAFDNWLNKFRTEEWESDREDAQILIGRAEKELYSRTSLNNGVWLLSKDRFEEGSKKLADGHWIYIHFETFIEIDRENRLIRTFDFGYD